MEKISLNVCLTQASKSYRTGLSYYSFSTLVFFILLWVHLIYLFSSNIVFLGCNTHSTKILASRSLFSKLIAWITLQDEYIQLQLVSSQRCLVWFCFFVDPLSGDFYIIFHFFILLPRKLSCPLALLNAYGQLPYSSTKSFFISEA